MNTIKLLKNVIMSSPGHILLYVGLFFVVTVFGEIRVGLVLGGGAARGLAHIGVLKALEEYNIPIDAVGGTSMGAIIGALWSSGYSASEIESIFVQTNVLNQIFDFSFENEKPVYYKFNYQNTILNLYYNKGKLQRPEAAIDDRLLNFEIKKFFQPVEIAIDSNFRNLWKPFLCTASDINSSKLLVFTSGSLSKAVRSSMSLPIIFKPVEYEDKILLDGGIYNNLPVKITADSFNLDYIISVDVSTHKTVLSSDNIDILDIGFSMMDLITKGVNADTMEEYGTYIHPDVNAFFGYEFYKVKELIDLGYNETIKHIQKMKSEINRSENYNNSKRKTKGSFNYSEFVIDSIEIHSSNPTHRTITRNVINMKKGFDFSFAEFEKGLILMHSLDLFENIETEFFPDTIDKTMKIVISNNALSSIKIGLGGFYADNAGMNIYSKFEYNNIFSQAISASITPYLGDHLKGISVNIYSPPVFISGVAAYINFEFIDKKMYSLWLNTFNHNTYLSFTYLLGNNYTKESIISLIAGFRKKDYSPGDFSKIFMGSYFINDRINTSGRLPNGYRFNFLFTINIPQSDSSSFFTLSYDTRKLYLKMFGQYFSQANLFLDIYSGLKFEVGYLKLFQHYSSVHQSIESDYFTLKPLPSFNYIYDISTLSNYFLNIGFDLSYPINEAISIKSTINTSFIENDIYNTSSILITAGLYSEISGILGNLIGGFEYISDNANRKIGFSIIWKSNSTKKVDVLDEI